jgi:hypothetical protein
LRWKFGWLMFNISFPPDFAKSLIFDDEIERKMKKEKKKIKERERI